MKHVRLFFSSEAQGSLAYKGVSEAVINKCGFSGFRIKGIFNKGLDTDINKIVDIIELNTIPSIGRIAHVIINLEGFPYSWISDHDINSLPKQNQKQAASFANRFIPLDSRIDNYRDLLNDLIREITRRGLIMKVSFELWNEPDAPLYNWGTYEEFIKWTKIKYDILRFEGRPIYTGGFTSNMIRSKGGFDKQNYWNHLSTDTIYDDPNVIPSWHWYWTDSKGEWTDASTLPTREFNGLALTEYNLYSTFSKGNEPVYEQRKAAFNSPEYPYMLMKLLTRLYDLDLPTVPIICLHTLYDAWHDGLNSMGMWYNTGTKDMKYRPAWTHLLALTEAIKNPSSWDKVFTYEPIPGGLKGLRKKIIFNEDHTYNVTDL